MGSLKQVLKDMPGQMEDERLDMVRRALINFALTPKNDIATQLALGTRYFYFRPGYGMPVVRMDNKLRHQHSFIPGHEFMKFLFDLVVFLKVHTGEIVVVHVKFDGFMLQEDMKPTPTAINEHLNRAVENAGITLGATAVARPTYAVVCA